MTPLSCRILYIALPALLLSKVFSAGPAAADSIVRIIGARTTNTPAPSSDLTVAAQPPQPALPAEGNSTIRIVGDKPITARVPVNAQEPEQEPSQALSSIKKIRILGDRAETVQEQTPAQPAAMVGVEQTQRIKQTAVEESTPEEASEELLAQKLAALKAEEERKAAEKAEQELLARIKIEVENETARQAAIKQEQELLAARKAEESRIAAEKAEQEQAIAEATRQAAVKKEQDEQRKAETARLALIKKEEEQQATLRAEELRRAADKAEQERIAAIKADEERLTAARRVLVESRQPEPTLQQSSTIIPLVDSPATVDNALDTRLNTATGSTNSSTPTPASIWTLYLAAKTNDPALGRTEARVTGSKADSDLLLAGLMPHLNSTAGVKQISQSLKNYSTNDANYDYTALNYNITASLTLLHVPTLYSLSAASAALNAEQAGVVAARQNLIVKFTDSYFSLLKAQTDKQIALGEINRLKQVLDQSQAFLKAGTGDIISVYEAQSRLDSAGADLTKSESNLRLAEQKLSSQVGKPVTDVVNYLPQQPMGPDPDNLDWWVETMEKEQPAIRQAREGLTQTSEQRKAAKAEYLPILQASGGYDVNRGTAALPTAEVRQWFVGATISLPLYSGGETSAKIRRAVASEEERRHIFDETLDQQRENIKQAFYNLRYNISLIKALDQRKTSAEVQLAAVKKGRKIGTRNAIDVLNAEQTYSLALRDYRYALYDNIIRLIQLKSAAGILGEADVAGLVKIEAPDPGVGLNMIISQIFK